MNNELFNKLKRRSTKELEAAQKKATGERLEVITEILNARYIKQGKSVPVKAPAPAEAAPAPVEGDQTVADWLKGTGLDVKFGISGKVANAKIVSIEENPGETKEFGKKAVQYAIAQSKNKQYAIGLLKPRAYKGKEMGYKANYKVVK